LLKVENFQLQNFFPTENLCRPITFYKIFFPLKIFLSGNGRLAHVIFPGDCKTWILNHVRFSVCVEFF
jgi:hypothetical protein